VNPDAGAERQGAAMSDPTLPRGETPEVEARRPAAGPSPAEPRADDWREALRRTQRRDDAVAVFVALVATAALVLGVLVFDQLVGGLFR
jgi:hypothetical protein